MTEKDFQANLKKAESFRRSSTEPGQQKFWQGYMRGLRRHYYGEKFGTEEDHNYWLQSMQSADESQRMIGVGYSAGYEGIAVTEAMKMIKKGGE